MVWPEGRRIHAWEMPSDPRKWFPLARRVGIPLAVAAEPFAWRYANVGRAGRIIPRVRDP